MSLLALAAWLGDEHEYTIVDGNLEPDPQAVIDSTIGERDVAVLAVTVMPGPQLAQAVPLCRDLKRRHPGLFVVWGGYFPTQHYDACLAAPYVDFVLRGYGEVAFRNLVDTLAAGEQIRSMAGLAHRDPATGAIVANPPAAAPDPDLAPDFPYARVPMERYARRTFMGNRTLPHHSSYGCPFACDFSAVVNMGRGRWIAQSAERTVLAVRSLVERWGANAIELYDNNFFVHEGRSAEFADRIRHLGIGWWAEGRVDTLLEYSDQTWAQLRTSGLRMIFMGAESGSDDTLRRMKKGELPRPIRRWSWSTAWSTWESYRNCHSCSGTHRTQWVTLDRPSSSSGR